jgi:hypothetical protein
VLSDSRVSRLGLVLTEAKTTSACKGLKWFWCCRMDWQAGLHWQGQLA